MVKLFKLLLCVLATTQSFSALATDQPQQAAPIQADMRPLPPLPNIMSPLDVAKQQFSMLTPEQIEELGQYIDQVKFSTDRATPGPVAKPVTSSQVADLSPGAAPIVIRLSRHFGAALVFTDMAGTPWPIKGNTNFSKGLFEVAAPVEGGNILTIMPRSTYGAGNAIVVLEGVSTPISLSFVTGQGEADYRKDIKVPGVNPAKVVPLPVGAGVPSVPMGLSVYLDGIPPDSAKELKVTGLRGVRAWKTKEGDFVVVTRNTVLSPAYLDGLGAADGTRAYRISPTPVVLVSVNGNPKNVEITED